MGLFDGIKKAVTSSMNPLSGGVMGLAGDLAAGKQGDLGGNFPQIDERVGQLNDEQRSEAGRFRNDLPGLKEQQFNLARDQAAQGLKGQTRDIRQGASSRGLLYSGLRQGAENAAQGSASSGLSAQREAINRKLGQQANEMDQSSIQSGVDLMALRRNREDLMNGANKSDQERASGAKSGIMGGFGSLLGGIAGRK